MSQSKEQLLNRYEQALERFLCNRSPENRAAVCEIDLELRRLGLELSLDHSDVLRKVFSRWNYGIEKDS